MEDKLDVFVRRLKKIGIETDYFANYPWIYFNSINGQRVVEKFQSDYGFVVGYRNKGFTFENLSEIFKLIRKYVEKRELVYNAIRTPDKTVLVSYHRHDYKSHLDDNKETYVIDGGLDYVRTSINKEPAESLAIYSDAPFEQIREFMHRGGRGKNMDEPLKYIPLKDIDDDWLQAIIDYEELNRPSNRFLKFYLMEKQFRKTI